MNNKLQKIVETLSKLQTNDQVEILNHWEKEILPGITLSEALEYNEEYAPDLCGSLILVAAIKYGMHDRDESELFERIISLILERFQGINYPLHTMSTMVARTINDFIMTNYYERNDSAADLFQKYFQQKNNIKGE